jgi:hypothetical protein
VSWLSLNDEGAIADLVDTMLATSPDKVEQSGPGRLRYSGSSWAR